MIRWILAGHSETGFSTHTVRAAQSGCYLRYTTGHVLPNLIEGCVMTNYHMAEHALDQFNDWVKGRPSSRLNVEDIGQLALEVVGNLGLGEYRVGNNTTVMDPTHLWTLWEDFVPEEALSGPTYGVKPVGTMLRAYFKALKVLETSMGSENFFHLVVDNGVVSEEILLTGVRQAIYEGCLPAPRPQKAFLNGLLLQWRSYLRVLDISVDLYPLR